MPERALDPVTPDRRDYITTPANLVPSYVTVVKLSSAINPFNDCPIDTADIRVTLTISAVSPRRDSRNAESSAS